MKGLGPGRKATDAERRAPAWSQTDGVSLLPLLLASSGALSNML